jgi:hypothetical protein
MAKKRRISLRAFSALIIIISMEIEVRRLSDLSTEPGQPQFSLGSFSINRLN